MHELAHSEILANSCRFLRQPTVDMQIHTIFVILLIHKYLHLYAISFKFTRYLLICTYILKALQIFAKIHKDLGSFGRICDDLYGFAWICKDLQGFAKICKDLYGRGRICNDLQGFVRDRKVL